MRTPAPFCRRRPTFARRRPMNARPANPTPFQQRVIAAMQSDIRTPEERARDLNRLPAEILSFFRMREDMRVIEILPAGGWFTKILGPVLKDRASSTSYIPTAAMPTRIGALPNSRAWRKSRRSAGAPQVTAAAALSVPRVAGTWNGSTWR